MAAWVDASRYDWLHLFVGVRAWDSTSVEATLLQQAGDLLGCRKARQFIDDTALPKKGNASVGFALQCALALG